MTRTTNHRCVLGVSMFLPNKLTYLRPLSLINHKVWVGHCDGDKTHIEHIIMLRKTSRKDFIQSQADIFKTKEGQSTGKRLFDRGIQLKCPVGKCKMLFEKTLTNKLNIDHIDIYKCKGHRKGNKHKPHLVKIQHGVLDSMINKKIIGVIIIINESD